MKYGCQSSTVEGFHTCHGAVVACKAVTMHSCSTCCTTRTTPSPVRAGLAYLLSLSAKCVDAHLKGQLLKGSTGFQPLNVADLIVSKAGLAQGSELVQPLNAPQALICHAQLHNMTPPRRWLWARLPICSQEKITPFSVSSMKSQVLYRAAQYL